MRHDGKLLNLRSLTGVDALFQFGPAPPTEAEIPQPPASSNEPAVPALSDAQLLDVHDYERQRLGQELHDSAGQLLVSLQLSVARLRAPAQNCDNDPLIEEIQETVRQIDKEIRTLAFLDHPAELGDRSLCEAVRSLVAGFGRRTGIRTSFKCPDNPAPRPESISVALLRVAQEALVNVHRHSHASSAKVTIEADADQLRLTVSDNGVGIKPGWREVRGVGLDGMRQRVEMQGGRFNVRSLKHGTKISAIVPLVA